MLQNVNCGSHLGKYVGINADDTMIEKSVSKLSSNFNYLMSIFKDCGYEIKYKLFKTFCMDLYGCVLWKLMGNCINRFFTTWRKCIRQLLGLPIKTHRKYLHVLVNDIPIDAKVHKRFLNFDSVLKSSNPVVKLCGKLVLSGSRSTVCKSLNYI